MEVRELRRDEILSALHVIWEVFVSDVSLLYTREGVEKFRESVRYANVFRLYESREIVMFGAFEEGELAGAISVWSQGRIDLFCVKKEWQGRGCGRRLFEAARSHCLRVLRLARMTVEAPPNALAVCQHLGMRVAGAEQIVDGIRYVPMEMYIDEKSLGSPGARDLREAQAGRDSSKTNLVIAGIVTAAFLFLLLLLVMLILFTGMVFRTIGRQRQNERYYQEWPYDEFYDYFYDGFYGGGAYNGRSSGGEEEPMKVGLDLISPHVEEDLPYEIEEDNYAFMDEERQTAYIDFFVQYPVVNGLSESLEKKVNEILKECAMESVEEIYENPSQEMKEKVLESVSPVLASYVQYKVCYASESFLSVAFEDYSYRGNIGEYEQNFRTVNINLNDGAIYELTDIVNVSDQFTKMWIGRMRSRDGHEDVFSELTEEELRETLLGDSMGGVYVTEFFMDGAGLNVGYDLHYEAGDPDDVGYTWLMAVLGLPELEPYAKESPFWDSIDSIEAWESNN